MVFRFSLFLRYLFKSLYTIYYIFYILLAHDTYVHTHGLNIVEILVWRQPLLSRPNYLIDILHPVAIGPLMPGRLSSFLLLFLLLIEIDWRSHPQLMTVASKKFLKTSPEWCTRFIALLAYCLTKCIHFLFKKETANKNEKRYIIT